MKRRNFLKGLFPAAAAIIALPVMSVATPTVSEVKQYLTYKGFKIKWRGWIPIMNQDVIVGTWMAYGKRPDGWHVYSSYPGVTEKCFSGCMFNISVQKGQQYPNPMSTLAELGRYKNDAFHRLIDYINEHYAELTYES